MTAALLTAGLPALAAGEADKPQVAVQAESGALKVVQVATPDPQGLMTEWSKPGESVELRSLGARTVKDKPIVVFIIFSGCAVDAAGHCNLTADFETLAPDGKTIGVVKDLPVLVGEAPLGGGQFQICPAGYTMIAHDDGPFGLYRVKLTVTDHVAGVSVKTEQVLQIDEK